MEEKLLQFKNLLEELYNQTVNYVENNRKKISSDDECCFTNMVYLVERGKFDIGYEEIKELLLIPSINVEKTNYILDLVISFAERRLNSVGVYGVECISTFVMEGYGNLGRDIRRYSQVEYEKVRN